MRLEDVSADVARGRERDLFAVDGVHRTVRGGLGEEGDDLVHEVLDALQHRGGADEDRDDLGLGDRQSEQLLEVLLRERLALEVLHHELVVGLGRLVGELLARALGGGDKSAGISSMCSPSASWW